MTAFCRNYIVLVLIMWYCCDVYYAHVTKLGMADLGARVSGGVGAGQGG
jgi:hypothetical protein